MFINDIIKKWQESVDVLESTEAAELPSEADNDQLLERAGMVRSGVKAGGDTALTYGCWMCTRKHAC